MLVTPELKLFFKIISDLIKLYHSMPINEIGLEEYKYLISDIIFNNNDSDQLPHKDNASSWHPDKGNPNKVYPVEFITNPEKVTDKAADLVLEEALEKKSGSLIHATINEQKTGFWTVLNIKNSARITKKYSGVSEVYIESLRRVARHPEYKKLHHSYTYYQKKFLNSENIFRYTALDKYLDDVKWEGKRK
jgi:hypothetical protein